MFKNKAQYPICLLGIILIIFINHASLKAEVTLAEKFLGEWNFALNSGQEIDAYAYAQNYRYPHRLKIIIDHGKYKFELTDINGYTAKSSNIFFWGKYVILWENLGVKDGVGIYPIHLLTLTNGKVEGAVVTDKLLFRYSGVKIRRR
jgi:hypothetical protein